MSSSDAAGLRSGTCGVAGECGESEIEGEEWLVGSDSMSEFDLGSDETGLSGASDNAIDGGSGREREASKGRGSESKPRPFGGGEVGKGIAAGDNG